MDHTIHTHFNRSLLGFCFMLLLLFLMGAYSGLPILVPSMLAFISVLIFLGDKKIQRIRIDAHQIHFRYLHWTGMRQKSFDLSAITMKVRRVTTFRGGKYDSLDFYYTDPSRQEFELHETWLANPADFELLTRCFPAN